MPGVIMMGSLFCLFIIEMYMNAKTGGHSHGGPTGEAPVPMNMGSPPRPPRPSNVGGYPDDKKEIQRMYDDEYGRNMQDNPFMTNDEKAQSDMPAWFIVFYEQYVRQRLELVKMIQNAAPSYNYSTSQDQQISRAAESFDTENQTVDPSVYKKLSAQITILEGGILFHSVFVGITVSLTVDGYIVLLVAILFHQMFEGLGLGSRIAEVPYPKKSIRPWVLVFAFGTTAPIGQAIGILARDSYDPNSAFGLIIVGVFNAM